MVTGRCLRVNRGGGRLVITHGITTAIRSFGYDLVHFASRLGVSTHMDLPMLLWLSVRVLNRSKRRALIRGLVYFVGLLEHLEDLCLIYNGTALQSEPVDDLTLIPPFAPSL